MSATPTRCYGRSSITGSICLRHKSAFLTGYKRVNSKFAEALSPILRDDDIIWIHDYHLIPLAMELRRRGHRQKIGFFLHIPFPPQEIFSATPGYDWLGRTFLSYDTIGFQTRTDSENFEQFLAGTFRDDIHIENNVARYRGRSTTIGCFPIGIDVDAFREIAHSPEADARIADLHRRTTARLHVIGVERLDYSKGLPDRLRAFGLLLRKYPELQKRVTLMQIAPPTRENVEAYSDIREELEKLSGAINGEFADFDWTPVRYIHRAVPTAHSRRPLSRQRGRLRDAVAGWHEPRREGIRRRPGRRQSRRPRPFAVRRRRRGNGGSAAGQSTRHRGDE